MDAEVGKNVTADQINAAMKKAADGAMKGVLEYCEDPIVSVDVIGNSHSSVFDSLSTSVMDGNFVKVENIGSPVNSAFSEADPAIAPDETYLLFCSLRPDGFGESDLFISFRKPDGSWTAPINMGSEINTAASDEKPYVTPDGKYLFFSNDAPGNLEIYWVDAKIIEDFKPEELK